MTAVLLAASEWSYVTLAYGVVIVTLVASAAFVIVRGRRVGQQLPAQERRWLK